MDQSQLMQRSLLFLLALLSLPTLVHAQNIGINVDGTAPHPSALHDIDGAAITGTKRGLLIPRVTATEMNAIVAPATSLLVFNTTAGGFFFFNGTAWTPLSGPTGWGLTGNAGTNPATNFIGTTDAQPLRFRAGNIFAGQLPSVTYGALSLGLNAGALSTGIFNTFLGNGTGGANTTGNGNTYVGGFAGASNVNGSDNVYLGRLAGVSAQASSSVLVGYEAGPQVTSVDNVMVGKWAGVATTSGHSNTFLGASSGQTTTTGSENVYVGEAAGNLNITGSGNTFVGQASSGMPSSVSNATAIGHQALAGGGNTVVLGSIAGVNGRSLVITLPGSTRGAQETMDALFPFVLHVVKVQEHAFRHGM